MSNENQKLPPNPMQPFIKDAHGRTRFKANAIVDKLYEFAKQHGYGMNEIACDEFSNDDRMQFAQLIGYSLGGYGELSYVTDDAYKAAQMAADHPFADPFVVRAEVSEEELNSVRKDLRPIMARLFGVHPDDLSRNIK